YLKAIIDILGRENASRLLYTDLKWHGFDNRDCILPIQADEGLTPSFAQALLAETHPLGSETRGLSRSPAGMLEWQFRKAQEYGSAGFWIWAYQDSGSQHFGLRDASGIWRQDLVNAIRKAESSRP
ncbi:MAG: hypothetical protein IT364_03695, partial [Candidatus Hydrogenedentes bacterium]|nr:hypothetical protein [Candidatus Hydrogenedentota bacterium]